MLLCGWGVCASAHWLCVRVAHWWQNKGLIQRRTMTNTQALAAVQQVLQGVEGREEKNKQNKGRTMCTLKYTAAAVQRCCPHGAPAAPHPPQPLSVLAVSTQSATCARRPPDPPMGPRAGPGRNASCRHAAWTRSSSRCRSLGRKFFLLMRLAARRRCYETRAANSRGDSSSH